MTDVPRPPQQPAPIVPAGSPPMAAQGSDNGMAVAALVMGILALITAVLFFPIAFVFGVLGIIFGVLGRKAATRNPAAGRGGMAMAGIITSILGLLLAIAISLLVGLFIFGITQSSDFQHQLDKAGQSNGY